jgi:hypothetical protein
MEWQGHAALLVQAQDSNLKITTAADLALLQAVLQHRAQSGGAGAAAGLVHDATAHGTR